MICPSCGTYIPDDSITCPKCAHLLSKNEQPEEVREGRRALPRRERRAQDRIGIDAAQREVRFLEQAEQSYIMPKPEENKSVDQIVYDQKTIKKLSRNWVYRGVFIAVIIIGIFIGISLYFQRTDSGQLILARSFRADSAQAYWIVGEEFLNAGDIVNAIRAFTIADAKDPGNADGLLALASAYEASNLNTQAEDIYRRIIKDISPARQETYRALVRMLTAQDRMTEVAEVLRLAVENTGSSTFREQLADILPESPVVSLPGGRYNSEKTVTISSPQGYEIYYIMDDGSGKLPEDGKLYKGEELKIPEGAVILRAVCKSINLVSEPTTVRYILIYPSPSAPKASLAPGTFSKRIPVSLRNVDKKEKDLVIHYTIDGSIPTENSPIFDGTPIQMPSGRVTLRAFAKNTRGKTSANQAVDYKFDVKPYPTRIYDEEDKLYGIILYLTTQDEFFASFGRSEDVTDSTYGSAKTTSKIYRYEWGEAEFVLVSNKWILARLDMRSKFTELPRGVGFGSTEAEVVAAYKDMGQLPNLDGTRGLYYALPNTGRIDVDEQGTRYIRYSAGTSKGVNWILMYYLSNEGTVNRIVHYYE